MEKHWHDIRISQQTNVFAYEFIPIGSNVLIKKECHI